MALTVFDETEPYVYLQAVAAVDTPTTPGLASGNTRTLRIDRLQISTDDTADVLVFLELDDQAGTIAQLGSLLIPAGAGFDPAVPSVDLLTSAGLAGVGLAMRGDMRVRVNIPSALTATKTLWIVGLGGFI